MSKSTTIVLIVILVVVAGLFYWYFSMSNAPAALPYQATTTQNGAPIQDPTLGATTSVNVQTGY